MLLYYLQTFDFDKPGELTMLERHACLSYHNQQHPDMVCCAAAHLSPAFPHKAIPHYIVLKLTHTHACSDSFEPG